MIQATAPQTRQLTIEIIIRTIIISTPRPIKNHQSMRNQMTPLQIQEMKRIPNTIYHPSLMIYYHFHHQTHLIQKIASHSAPTLSSTKIENQRKKRTNK